jgi:hypothetical protein
MSIKRDLMKDKLLDPKSFNTVYISIEDENQVRQEQMETLIELLCDTKYKSSQGQIYNFLKKEPKAVDLLIRAIDEAKGDKKRLIEVCWEADLDCSRHLALFTGIVLNDEFQIALEAMTVIEHMSPDIAVTPVAPLIDKVRAKYTSSDPKAALYMDLMELLRRWE